MSAIPIVCDNCGAKYRLPETFAGDKAKCKQCGSVIDVAAQRRAGAQGAVAPAAAAKPAAPVRPAAPAHSGHPARPAPAEASPARGARERRAGRHRDAAAEGGETAAAGGRHGRRHAHSGEHDKPGPNKLLIGVSVGVLAAVAVVAVLMLNQDDKPAVNESNAASADAGKPAPKPAAKPDASQPAAPSADKPAASPAPGPAAADGKPATPGATDASAPKPAGSPAQPAGGPAAAATSPAATGEAPKPATPAEPVIKGEEWKNLKIATMAEVFDPKTLPEVRWAAEITDETKARVRSLLDDVVGGGRPGIAAKPKLEALGFPALFGLIERLHQIDYKSAEESMTAWEINKVIEAITAGLNTGFVAVSPGEDLDPRKAHHNALTVKAWDSLLARESMQDSAGFEKWRKERQAKQSK